MERVEGGTHLLEAVHLAVHLLGRLALVDLGLKVAGNDLFDKRWVRAGDV